MGKDKDADDNKIRADPEKVKECRDSFAKMADIYCSDAWHMIKVTIKDQRVLHGCGLQHTVGQAGP